MKKFLKRLWSEDSGQDLVEYCLLAVLLALAAIGSIKFLATGLDTAYRGVAAGLSAPAQGGGQAQ